MARVVVTGAAGSLGRRVLALLAQGPDEVVAVDVDPLDPPPGVEVVAADLARPAAADRLASALDGAEGVIHLAWRIADGPGDGPAEEAAAVEANLAALRNVLGAAAKAGATHVVHVSSATVYGAWPDNPVPLTEDAPLRPVPGFPYAVTKAEAERIVAGWADEHPRAGTAVLRPTVTVGSPERALYQALGGIRSPRGDDGARLVQFVHVDDLARAVALAWSARLVGVYNVAPDRGVAEGTARALAGGVARVPLPARAAHAVAGWSWDLWRSGLPREARAYARWPWVVAPDRLLAAGWQPEHTSEEALVVADDRAHWDDLPPGRRQNLTVLAAAGAVAAVGAGAAAAIVAGRRRAARRRVPFAGLSLPKRRPGTRR